MIAKHTMREGGDATRFFTPSHILDAVREIGPIGLDPCADPHARVAARRSIMFWPMVYELLQSLAPMPYQWDPLDPANIARMDEIAALDIIMGDGLREFWGVDFGEVVYVNPPYGLKHNGPWAKKCAEEGAQGRQIIALVPASVGAGWFKHYWKADAICFVDGRIAFDHMHETSAHKGMFDSAIPYWGTNKARFREVFSAHGKVVLL